MNPGALEETAKAAGSFMETMKAQPLSLALVVMNLALLALVGYIAHARGIDAKSQRQDFIQAVMHLAKCQQ